MLKRNYTYNVGDIEYSVSGVRLTCKTAGTTSTEDLVIPSNVSEVTDGTVVWSLIDISGGNDQVGTIIQYFGSNPPKGFLSCDGSIYNIIDYSRLANHIEVEFGSKNFFGGDGTSTFAVPDLRGEFLRGTGTNSHTNQGSGENVGVHQDGTEHVGSLGGIANVLNPKSQSGANAQVAKVDSGLESSTEIWLSDAQTYSLNNIVKYTSRPTNTSVLYCIRW